MNKRGKFIMELKGMKELAGTKTEQNLWKAFAGESQARNKYTFFASAARKEGYNQIAAIFEETAGNEREHAKMWFKLLDGISADTKTNLLAAAAGENEEWTDMYPTKILPVYSNKLQKSKKLMMKDTDCWQKM